MQSYKALIIKETQRCSFTRAGDEHDSHCGLPKLIELWHSGFQAANLPHLFKTPPKFPPLSRNFSFRNVKETIKVDAGLGHIYNGDTTQLPSSYADPARRDTC